MKVGESLMQVIKKIDVMRELDKNELISLDPL